MIHILISGMVQGIGFRQFIKSNANKLNISGWVKNNSDGSVEAMLAGRPQNLKEMIEICKKGPFLAEVKSFEIEKLDDQKFEGFQIIKD